MLFRSIARTGIKPMTLELGGKSPQLVFADADLPQAAAAIARSILGNAGQACVAGSRLIVAESVAEQLVALIVERMSAVRPGATWDAASAYSPITRPTGSAPAFTRATCRGRCAPSTACRPARSGSIATAARATTSCRPEATSNPASARTWGARPISRTANRKAS